MERAYLETKRAKLLKNVERGLLLAKAKLENRLVIVVDKDGKANLADDADRPEKDNRRCIRLNTGNEPKAVGYSAPISNVLDLLEAGRPKMAAGELEAVFDAVQESLSSNSTSVQFLKMAIKNLNRLCQLDEYQRKMIGEGDQDHDDFFIFEKMIE